MAKDHNIPSVDLMYSTGEEAIEKRRLKEMQIEQEEKARKQKRQKMTQDLERVVNESSIIQAVVSKKKAMKEDIIEKLCTLSPTDDYYDRQIMLYVQQLKDVQADLRMWEESSKPRQQEE